MNRQLEMDPTTFAKNVKDAKKADEKLGEELKSG
jgi:hypothetical protein